MATAVRFLVLNSTRGLLNTFADGPETTQIAVYAQVKSCDEPSQDKTPTIQLRVGRLTLRPPQKPVRLPRPDDPIPRKPPIAFGRVDSRGTLKPGELKRAASGTLALNGGVKRPKLVGGGSVSNLGSGVRLAPTASSSDVFKVPELPKQAVKQAKGNDKEKEDVFGGVSEVGRLQGADAKGKRKADELDDLLELEEEEIDGGALERANKNVSLPCIFRIFTFSDQKLENQEGDRILSCSDQRSGEERNDYRQESPGLQGVLWGCLSWGLLCSGK